MHSPTNGGSLTSTRIAAALANAQPNKRWLTHQYDNSARGAKIVSSSTTLAATNEADPGVSLSTCRTPISSWLYHKWLPIPLTMHPWVAEPHSRITSSPSARNPSSILLRCFFLASNAWAPMSPSAHRTAPVAPAVVNGYRSRSLLYRELPELAAHSVRRAILQKAPLRIRPRSVAATPCQAFRKLNMVHKHQPTVLRNCFRDGPSYCAPLRQCLAV